MKSARLGPYVLECLLGQGGMGQVWRARDSRNGQPVAVKLLGADWLRDEMARRRFAREVRALSSVRHPHVLQVLDSGEAEGQPYLVTEIVRGKTLRQLGRVAPAQAVELLGQLLSGLEAAHQAGWLHRDIKPENLVVDSQGQLKILDFGLARPVERGRSYLLTGARTMLGTPGYVAPEALAGAAEKASDLFSVGAVAHLLLTGRPSFAGDSPTQILRGALIQEYTPPADLPPALRGWLATALAKDPSRRFHSAAAMAEALLAASTELSTQVIGGRIDVCETPTLSRKSDTMRVEGEVVTLALLPQIPLASRLRRRWPRPLSPPVNNWLAAGTRGP